MPESLVAVFGWAILALVLVLVFASPELTEVYRRRQLRRLQGRRFRSMVRLVDPKREGKLRAR